MDGEHTALKEGFELLLQELASVGERLQRSERPAGEAPHYSQIEGFAHEMGRRLSQAIQRDAALEIAGSTSRQDTCPDCGRTCALERKERTIQSVDGPTEISEPVGHCPHCQRSFFPSA